MDSSRRGERLMMYLSRLKAEARGPGDLVPRSARKKTLQAGFPWGGKHTISLGS